jgi:predicted nucleic acid-binding protein
VTPNRLVLDIGVLISLFNRKDAQHEITKQGFAALDEAHSRMVVPVAVVLEVSKRLLFDVNATVMQTATQAMLEMLDVRDTTPRTIRDALEMIQSMKGWGATLEDAIVIQTALVLDVPVWTLNYRDFAAVKTLRFWTP